MTPTDLIGWSSSAVLLVTLGQQVLKQWRSGTSSGVSPWLFVGQLAASVGFLVYSVLLENWVFAVTNGCLTINAILGQLIVIEHRRRPRRSSPRAAAHTGDAARTRAETPESATYNA